MRNSLVISLIAHAGIILWATIGFPGATPFEAEPMKVLPVDIVEASEVTRLKAGEKEAEAADDERQEKETAKPDEAEKEKPVTKTVGLPPAPSQPEPDAPETAVPAPRPPEPEENRAEPEPAPKKPEDKAEEAEPEQEEQEEAVTEPAPVPPPRPAHTPKPRPAQKAEPEQERAFDPDRIAALLDKSPERSAPAPSGEAAEERPAQGDPRGLDERMSLSELDALRQQISRCWSPPVGVRGARDLVIQLRLALNRDGRVVGQPEVISRGSGTTFMAAADSARRAVLRCQPYELPVAKYDAWRDIQVNFDPREMLGG